ncbi:hypothetical protein A2U01_0060886, partial [Trifolium medium]|nr:hypothetical protein [Trifolium medium]
YVAQLVIETPFCTSRGKCKVELYYFQGIRREKACKTDGVNLVDLWYKGMGHPSMKITQMIPGANRHEN